MLLAPGVGEREKGGERQPLEQALFQTRPFFFPPLSLVPFSTLRLPSHTYASMNTRARPHRSAFLLLRHAGNVTLLLRSAGVLSRGYLLSLSLSFSLPPTLLKIDHYWSRSFARLTPQNKEPKIGKIVS